MYSVGDDDEVVSYEEYPGRLHRNQKFMSADKLARCPRSATIYYSERDLCENNVHLRRFGYRAEVIYKNGAGV